MSKYNPGRLNNMCWFYPSRSGKSIELYLRGASSPSMHTTHRVRLSFQKLAAIANDLRKENSMVKHHGKPAPPRKPQPKKPPKY